MANRNVTVVCRSSQFKDYVSAKERLLFCDAKNSLDTQIKKTRLKNKKSSALCRHFFVQKQHVFN